MEFVDEDALCCQFLVVVSACFFTTIPSILVYDLSSIFLLSYPKILDPLLLLYIFVVKIMTPLPVFDISLSKLIMVGFSLSISDSTFEVNWVLFCTDHITLNRFA